MNKTVRLRPYQAEAFVRALTQSWDGAYCFWRVAEGATLAGVRLVAAKLDKEVPCGS